MINPLVSVIVPNYNNEAYLEECIDSVYNQSYRNIEVIIVDDGSTDNSKNVIDNLQSKYCSLKVLFKENGGPSTARNLGISISEGDIIAYLDSDDIWLPQKLEHQVNAILKDSTDIAFSEYNYLSENIRTPSHEKTLHDYSLISPLEFFYDNPLKGSASSVIMTKEVHAKVGNWDTYLRASEDPDYWLRCILAGFKVSYCPTVDLLIRKHSDNSSRDNKRMFYYQLISLDKWIALVKDSKFSISDRMLCDAIRARLSRLRFYAWQMKRFDLALYTFVVGYNYCGAKFFNRLTLVQFFKSLRNFFSKS